METSVEALKKVVGATIVAVVTFGTTMIVDKAVKSTIDKMEEELKPKKRFGIFPVKEEVK